MRRVMAIAISIGACGSPAPPAAPPSGPPAASVPAPASVTDLPVASVAGRPVYGSCVAAQVARGAPTREAALDECIAFELLAQAAEARGLALDHDVILETRRALVSRFVELEFERRYRTPDDLRAAIDAKIEEGRAFLNVPERRKTAHALVTVAKDAAPDAVDRARRVAEQLHAELADEVGLLAPHLEDAAQRIGAATGVAIKFQDMPYAPRDGRYVEAYETAVFAIPEVGRVAPVVRTTYGFHVILLTDLEPARTLTPEDVEPAVFAQLRHQRFQAWLDELARDEQVVMYDQVLEELER